MTTYLKDLTQSIGTYGARNLASMREKGKLNMFGRSMIIYFN